MQLTTSQFIYTATNALGMVNKLTWQEGKCRLCGGNLFTYENKDLPPKHRFPGIYNQIISDNWNSEHLASDITSNKICPACAWLISERKDFCQGGNLFLYTLTKGVITEKEAKDILEILLAPPDEPFILLLWLTKTGPKARSRIQPFKARISWQTSPYNVFLDEFPTWVYPEKLSLEVQNYLKQYKPPRTPEQFIAAKLSCKLKEAKK